MENKTLSENIRLFVLDMDGTFYLGEKLLDGAKEFLQAVEKAGREYLFFTNNSSKSPEDYMKKLAGLGCPIRRDQIMTSGDVTIRYLQNQYPGKTVYLVGTPSLEECFRQAHIPLTQQQPDVVVVGFDTTLTYEKLTKACQFIRQGAVFLATHLDVNCPTETGFIPDCGAICAAISLSTGRQPKFLGKPFGETVDMVLDKTGYDRSQVAFVGDRLYTDVATAVKNGATGILVLSGETKREDVAASGVQPSGIFEGLGEMAALLK